MTSLQFSELHSEANEAIQYFYAAGMIDNCHGDQQHYVDALVKFAAYKMHIELE